LTDSLGEGRGELEQKKASFFLRGAAAMRGLRRPLASSWLWLGTAVVQGAADDGRAAWLLFKNCTNVPVMF
jgi:hypothetical protein